MKLKQVDTVLGQFTIKIQNKLLTGDIVMSGFYQNVYAPVFKEFYFYSFDDALTIYAKYGINGAWIRLP